MTYHQLLKKLSKLTPDQLKQRVVLFETCSGMTSWAEEIEVCKENNLDDEGRIKVGDVIICHDH